MLVSFFNISFEALVSDANLGFFFLFLGLLPQREVEKLTYARCIIPKLALDVDEHETYSMH